MSKRGRSPSVVLPVVAGVVILGALGWTFLSPPREPDAPVAAPPAVSSGATSLPANASAEEQQQLADLRAQSDPATALQMADEGHHQFAGGGLYPDREAVAIRSLVRLGQQEQAQDRARRFLRRFPQHPQAELIRRMAKL